MAIPPVMMYSLRPGKRFCKTQDEPVSVWLAWTCRRTLVELQCLLGGNLQDGDKQKQLLVQSKFFLLCIKLQTALYYWRP